MNSESVWKPSALGTVKSHPNWVVSKLVFVLSNGLVCGDFWLSVCVDRASDV